MAVAEAQKIQLAMVQGLLNVAIGEGIGQVLSGSAGAVAGAGRSRVNNPVPRTLARVVDAGIDVTALGPPFRADVFVTDAAVLRGLNSAQIAERLTIPPSGAGFQIFEFPAASISGIASPIRRTDPGFVGRGLTAGGAPEFVIPNGPLPPGTTRRIVP